MTDSDPKKAVAPTSAKIAQADEVTSEAIEAALKKSIPAANELDEKLKAIFELSGSSASLRREASAPPDAVLEDQTVGRHRALPPDLLGAVGGLILHWRVPPKIEMYHVIGGGEVEAEAVRLEADQDCKIVCNNGYDSYLMR